jgi:hypothetical protein
MKLSKELKKVWKEELEISGPTLLSKESGSDRRTILNAIKTGECRQDVYDKVNSAILNLRGKRQNNPIVKQLIGDIK